MPSIIAFLWQRIIEANATFFDFILFLNEFSVRFFESQLAIGLFGENATFETVLDKYPMLPYLLMIFGLLEAFFGRRFLKTQKLLLGFIVGFAIGTVYIAPLVANIVPIDHVVIGFALGIVFAVFRSPLYWVTFTSVSFYLIYYQLINHLHFAKFWAMLISAVAVILVIVFLMKWVELLGTAVLGGWIFASAFTLLISFSDTGKTVFVVIVTVLIASAGFYVQQRHVRLLKRAKRALAEA